jgi:D-inositol-3-phosphate glycosyltransferase
MKIAMVSEHASPLATLGGVDAGGQNVHVSELAKALARRGHAVTVYTRGDGTISDRRVSLAPGVAVEHVPAGPPTAIPKDELLPFIGDFGRYLAAQWEHDPPDIVHGHFWMSGLACLLATKDTSIPVVQTFHALGVVKRRHQGNQDTSPGPRLRLEQGVARGADRVIATATDEVFELVRLGVRRSAISVVPCGVDSDFFAPAGPALPRDERHRLVVVGRLVQRKGVDDVIRALALVPKTELLIAGGPDICDLDTDPEAQRLMRLADRMRVSDRVTLLGRVARSELPALLRSADIVVCMPWYEPFGMVPLEAMACGRPVVASAVGGMIDTVVDGATGTLVRPQRPDMLAHALRRLLGDPIRRAGYGLAGRERAVMRYRWDRIGAETDAVYSSVLGLDAEGAAVSPSSDEDVVEVAR